MTDERVNYAAALNYLVPNALIRVRDAFDWLGFEWKDERPQPSQQDCLDVWPTVHTQMVNDLARGERQRAFVVEADPLFFGFQRGENTEQEWLDKVAEIRERFPYQS